MARSLPRFHAQLDGVTVGSTESSGDAAPFDFLCESSGDKIAYPRKLSDYRSRWANSSSKETQTKSFCTDSVGAGRVHASARIMAEESGFTAGNSEEVIPSCVPPKARRRQRAPLRLRWEAMAHYVSRRE
jgi:hypothetical protein